MKVWKVEEYCMYFPLFKLHRYANKFAFHRRRFIQRFPNTITIDFSQIVKRFFT